MNAKRAKEPTDAELAAAEALLASAPRLHVVEYRCAGDCAWAPVDLR